MTEKFLVQPNIPQNDVITVFANIDDIALKKAFDELSIKVVSVTENPLLDTPVSRHADILANYIGNDTFLVDKNQKELCKFIENNNGKYHIIDNISSPYPDDCTLNFADISDYVICKKSNLTDDILKLISQKNIIDVNQGYSKCSVCIAGKNTIITDDESVYTACCDYDDIKCLLIRKGDVKIEKYSYGFFGGCTGLVGRNLLLINGDLSTHSDYDAIVKFLNDNKIKYIDIKNKPLTDIGSIIPITEKGE